MENMWHLDLGAEAEAGETVSSFLMTGVTVGEGVRESVDEESSAEDRDME